MKDEDKTEGQHIHELEALRQKIAELETCLQQRKRAEEELQKSESKCWLLYQESPSISLIIGKDGLLKDANKKATEELGYSKDEVVGKPALDFVVPEQRENVAAQLEKNFRGERTPETEVDICTKDRSIHTILFSAGLVLYDEEDHPTSILVAGMDITARKQAEEALRQTRDYLENLFNHANAPIIVWDPSFTITRFNRAFEHLTGRSAIEVVGKQLDILFPDDRRREAMNHIRRASAGERWEVVEIPILHADWTVKIVLWNSATLYAEDGTTPIATIAQGQDITERKRVEEQIKASLREKEILLREIHHRVKNNLQIISALLNLQSKHAKDKETLEMFRESQNRIKSIALIHDQLYQFKDLAKINMAEYIQKLTTDLFYSYGVGRDRIELKLNAHDVLLGVNTAIPCGLVINELVSNSLKHAFQDRMKGEICIDFRSNNDHAFTLIVSDSGVGFPRDLDFRNTETLGLELVITLVEQLKGTIELDRSTGTTFKITFEEL